MSKQALIKAIKQYAQLELKTPVERVILILADGSKHEFDIFKLTDEGWDFRGSKASFNGTTFQLCGKSLSLFIELVQAGESGIDLNSLKYRLWESADDRTIQNAVSRLRIELRAKLGLDADVEVIEAANGIYRLANEV